MTTLPGPASRGGHGARSPPGALAQTVPGVEGWAPLLGSASLWCWEPKHGSGTWTKHYSLKSLKTSLSLTYLNFYDCVLSEKILLKKEISAL